MKTSLLLASCLALLTAPAQGAELRVGVVPISGSAPQNVRQRATQVLMDALAGMRGVAVVSFGNLDAVLGAAAKERLDACQNDACVIEATSAINTDRIALGSIDVEGPRAVLRLRLVRTSSGAEILARVTRDVTFGDDVLKSAVAQSALELLPEQAKDSVGMLEIAGAIPGARIVVDGRMSASVPLEATDPEAPAVLRLTPGVHQIRVSAPGHHDAIERAEVHAGQRTRLEIDLAKNRSTGPLILGGVGVAAGVAGVILGAVVRGRANDWKDACPSDGACAPGFTRERYDADSQSIDQQRTVANVLYGVAGGAAIGALIWFFVDPGTDPEVTE